jgi:hypothetical protein
MYQCAEKREEQKCREVEAQRSRNAEKYKSRYRLVPKPRLRYWYQNHTNKWFWFWFQFWNWFQHRFHLLAPLNKPPTYRGCQAIGRNTRKSGAQFWNYLVGQILIKMEFKYDFGQWNNFKIGTHFFSYFSRLPEHGCKLVKSATKLGYLLS